MSMEISAIVAAGTLAVIVFTGAANSTARADEAMRSGHLGFVSAQSVSSAGTATVSSR